MTKSDLRQQAKKILKTISLEDRKARSTSIWNSLFAHPFWQEASTILAYAALADEVDTAPLYQHIIQSKKALFLPHIESEIMQFYKVNLESTQMSIHPLGFLQPPRTQEVYCGQKYPHALLIAPALAADREGFRLGRGGGFYDKFLTQHKFEDRKIIALFEDCLWNIPHDQHDQAFDYILCDQGITRACPKTYYNAH